MPQAGANFLGKGCGAIKQTWAKTSAFSLRQDQAFGDCSFCKSLDRKGQSVKRSGLSHKSLYCCSASCSPENSCVILSGDLARDFRPKANHNREQNSHFWALFFTGFWAFLQNFWVFCKHESQSCCELAPQAQLIPTREALAALPDHGGPGALVLWASWLGVQFVDFCPNVLSSQLMSLAYYTLWKLQSVAVRMSHCGVSHSHSRDERLSMSCTSAGPFSPVPCAVALTLMLFFSNFSQMQLLLKFDSLRFVCPLLHSLITEFWLEFFRGKFQRHLGYVVKREPT